MIQPFVDRFLAAKESFKTQCRVQQPESYDDLFRRVIEILHDPEHIYDTPDPERITAIDHGSYQGTRLFTVAAGGYQPSKYWLTVVEYGSCSGCDSFESNRHCLGWGEIPSEPQWAKYLDGCWAMALHIVQGMKLVTE